MKSRLAFPKIPLHPPVPRRIPADPILEPITVRTTMSEPAVANAPAAPKEKKPTHNEEIKNAIPTLAGTLAAFPTTTRSS
jgi:hypothetical protein